MPRKVAPSRRINAIGFGSVAKRRAVSISLKPEEWANATAVKNGLRRLEKMDVFCQGFPVHGVFNTVASK
ncbi:MAG: hypothetical protein ACI9BD_001346, partial [Candidatus Marinamargulisbacteria bacterium]